MIKNIDIWLTNFLLSIGLWGYLLSCILIILESFNPILPLFVFVTLLFYKFGVILGFIISYVCTTVGCIVSYTLFNSSLRLKFENYIIRKDKKKIDNIVKSIRNVKFIKLCLIIALPFTPSFIVNVAAGLSDMNRRKYIIALLVGKAFLVIFWGFVGTSLINSFRNPLNLLYILLLLVGCFVVSKLVSKKEGLE